MEMALSITDLQAMLKAMTDLNMWKLSYDASDADLLAIGDLDHSGVVTNRDVQGLLNLLASQGGGTTAAVPEPSSLILMACGMGVVLVQATEKHSRPAFPVRTFKHLSESKFRCPPAIA